MGSVWCDVVDGLLTVMRGTAGYRSPSTTGTGIPVFDGPEVFATEDRPAVWLVVGSPGEDGGDEPGSAGQVAGPLAASTRPRDETGVVECLAVAQSGDAPVGGVRAVREAARAVVAAVESALRVGVSAPTLGLAADVVAQVTSVRWSQYLTDRGPVCEAQFTVSYRARV